MNYNRNEIKAGLMVFCCFLIFITFIILISGLDLMKSTKVYHLHLKHTGGVVVGSLVRYAGLEVGKVTQVRVSEQDETEIKVGIQIDSKIPVKTDSEAYLSALGLLGDYYIEISPGSAQATELPAGSLIPSRETTQFTQLTKPVEEISAKLQVLIDGLNDLLNDQSREHVASMIASMDSILVGNIQNINAIMGNLTATTHDFQQITKNLNTLFSNKDLKIDSTWSSINQTVLQLKALTEQLQGTAATLNKVLITRDQNLANILENVEQTTENLEKFAETIKDRPWSIIRKSSPPERKLP